MRAADAAADVRHALALDDHMRVHGEMLRVQRSDGGLGVPALRAGPVRGPGGAPGAGHRPFRQRVEHAAPESTRLRRFVSGPSHRPLAA
ncbi:hypothetical protein GCM10027203_64590 [Nonomuraea fastidiosa]